MDSLELVQYIGNEVCEGCGPDADCGVDPRSCFRIQNAIEELAKHVEEVAAEVLP